MSARQSGLRAACLAVGLWLCLPGTAAATDLNQVDVAGKNYVTLVFFEMFLTADCYQFEKDNTFVGTQGLLVGEWSNESMTIVVIPVILEFTINYVEVKLVSPENPVITCITVASDKLMIGTLMNDEEDSGFFVGIQAPKCRRPGRVTGELKPFPDHTVPAR